MFSFSVAFDKNRGIGICDRLPWHIKEELALFKKNTINKNIIMGRKTYQNLPSKLKNRNIFIRFRFCFWNVILRIRCIIIPINNAHRISNVSYFRLNSYKINIIVKWENSFFIVPCSSSYKSFIASIQINSLDFEEEEE